MGGGILVGFLMGIVVNYSKAAWITLHAALNVGTWNIWAV